MAEATVLIVYQPRLESENQEIKFPIPAFFSLLKSRLKSKSLIQCGNSKQR